MKIGGKNRYTHINCSQLHKLPTFGIYCVLIWSISFRKDWVWKFLLYCQIHSFLQCITLAHSHSKMRFEQNHHRLFYASSKMVRNLHLFEIWGALVILLHKQVFMLIINSNSPTNWMDRANEKQKQQMLQNSFRTHVMRFFRLLLLLLLLLVFFLSVDVLRRWWSHRL